VTLFAVVRTHGASWQPGKPLEAQQAWDAHASFMDDLEREGFVLLAGPLGDDDAPVEVRAKFESPRLCRQSTTSVDLAAPTAVTSF
jgi:hypothetical protein